MYAYRVQQRRTRRVRDNQFQCLAIPRARIVTLLDEDLKSFVFQCASAVFDIQHLDDFDAVAEAFGMCEVDAFVLSLAAVEPKDVPTVDQLLRQYPEVLPIAVFRLPSAMLTETVFAFGRSTVTKVIDLNLPAGCDQLRNTIEQNGGVIAKRVIRRVRGKLGDASDQTQQFFNLLLRVAPRQSTVRSLAFAVSMQPSTLMSRFYRSGLPSPKVFLMYARLLYAAAYFETGGLGVADVAHRLDYSSSQSFCRHVRMVLGYPVSRFRELGFEHMLERFSTDVLNASVPIFDRFRIIP